MSSIDDLPNVPSRDPLSYCRLCFSRDVYIRIKSPTAMFPWFKRIQTATGLGLAAPIAICDICCRELASAERFVDQCRRCDEALQIARGGKEPLGEVADDVEFQFVKTEVIEESQDQSSLQEETEHLEELEDGQLVDPEDIAEPLGGHDFENEQSVSSGFVALFDPHSLQEHNYETCYVCQIKFSKRAALVRHARQDHLNYLKVYQCNRCSLTFTNSHKFQQHVRTHLQSLKLDLCRCESCPGKSALKSNAPKMAPKKVQKVHTCTCGKTFKTKFTLDTHKQKHLSRCYRCGTCKNEFASVETYALHQQLAHQARRMAENGSVVYDCAPCKKGFVARKSYDLHIGRKHIKILRGPKIATFEAQLKHECESCHETFKNQAHLVRHITAAHDAVCFDCGSCGAKFGKIATYVEHQRMLHGTIGHSRMWCASCDIAFNNKGTFNRHIAMNHSSLQQDYSGSKERTDQEMQQAAPEQPEEIKLECPSDEIRVKVEEELIVPEEIYDPEAPDPIGNKVEFYEY